MLFSTVPSGFLLTIIGLPSSFFAKEAQNLLKKVLIKVLISCKQFLAITSQNLQAYVTERVRLKRAKCD